MTQPDVWPASLDTLEERRLHECRLRPERALGSLDEAHAFLRERTMLTRTQDSALPSLFGACHERPYKEGGRGFASWPATKYPWFGELAGRDDVYELSIHRGKSILMVAETAALADPLCRAELERREAGRDDFAYLLRHLEQTGPSDLEDVKLELGWTAPRLRAARQPLERMGALVSHSVTVTTEAGSHVHTSMLARWDQVWVDRSPAGGLEELVVAGVRAAVIAPHAEVEQWFSWRWNGAGSLAAQLVANGRLRRPAPGWVAANEEPLCDRGHATPNRSPATT
ncbi:MAG: hypothetical protein QOG33_2629 [Gaiellales bacterium]|nr:hypothetical protein [Gaiellales bacterium]